MLTPYAWHKVPSLCSWYKAYWIMIYDLLNNLLDSICYCFINNFASIFTTGISVQLSFIVLLRSWGWNCGHKKLGRVDGDRVTIRTIRSEKPWCASVHYTVGWIQTEAMLHKERIFKTFPIEVSNARNQCLVWVFKNHTILICIKIIIPHFIVYNFVSCIS